MGGSAERRPRRPDVAVADGGAVAISGVVKRVPPVERVRLRKLVAADGAAYVAVELEYHATGGEAVRLEFGLAPDDAAALGAHLSQLAGKLRSTDH